MIEPIIFNTLACITFANTSFGNITLLPLLLAHVYGASTEGETTQTAIFEPHSTEYIEHLFALRHGSYRAGQIGVGLLVARNNASHQGDDCIGIQLVELTHGKMFGRREFYYAQHATRRQHTIHLGKSLLQVFKVSHTIGYRNGIERIVGHRECQAIFYSKSNSIVNTPLTGFFAGNRQLNTRIQTRKNKEV